MPFDKGPFSERFMVICDNLRDAICLTTKMLLNELCEIESQEGLETPHMNVRSTPGSQEQVLSYQGHTSNEEVSMSE